jgi:cytochrome P450
MVNNHVEGLLLLWYDWAAEGIACPNEQVLDGAEPLPANVQELRYLQAVVLETLRLRPPAYIVGRCAATDVSLGGHQLPKGQF